MMKISRLLFFLIFIFILCSCCKKHKQEEQVYYTSEITQPKIEIKSDMKVDKEKLKKLSISISVDSINALLYHYSIDSSNSFFHTYEQLNSLGFKDLFDNTKPFEIGRIGDRFAQRYCLLNFQQNNYYWSIYLLSQRYPEYEDGYYCGSVIHLVTFDSTDKFINAVEIMSTASDAMNDLSRWCKFKILSDTSFSISIMSRYSDSFDAEHVKDYYRTFDSIGYTLLVNNKGHFFKKNVYSIHSFLELSEEDK